MQHCEIEQIESFSTWAESPVSLRLARIINSERYFSHELNVIKQTTKLLLTVNVHGTLTY